MNAALKQIPPVFFSPEFFLACQQPLPNLSIAETEAFKNVEKSEAKGKGFMIESNKNKKSHMWSVYTASLEGTYNAII